MSARAKVRGAIPCRLFGGVILFIVGCSTGFRPVVSVGVLSDDPALVSTQMLRPAVEATACGWTPLWARAPEVGNEAIRRALAEMPEATMLRNAQVESSMLHLGVARRECIRVRGEAMRRIGEVVLPALGEAHGPHH